MFSKKKGASWTYDTPSFIFLVLMHKKKHLHNEDAIQFNNLVGIPGLEPGMTGPESVVLPLHHIPISLQSL